MARFIAQTATRELAERHSRRSTSAPGLGAALRQGRLAVNERIIASVHAASKRHGVLPREKAASACAVGLSISVIAFLPRLSDIISGS